MVYKTTKEELTIFLKQNYIDILLISETHFAYKTISAYQVTNYATLPIQTEQHTEAQQYS